MRAIDIVPYCALEQETRRALELCLWQVFGLEAAFLHRRPVPAGAMDQARGQLASVAVLADCQRSHRPGAARTLGIVAEDLFIPMLTFVFGQAQVGGRCAVVSTARLRQEFYSFPANEALFTARLVREVVHEVGHTHGLVHCPNAACPMSLSNTIVQVDRKGEDLCPGCWTLLEGAIARGER